MEAENVDFVKSIDDIENANNDKMITYNDKIDNIENDNNDEIIHNNIENANIINNNDEIIDIIDTAGNIDDIDNLGNGRCVENDNLEYRDSNFISLYTQSKSQNTDTQSRDIKNSENNLGNQKSEKIDGSYISLYNQSEPHNSDDINGIVSKRNSFTLGEVRQALHNGQMEDIIGGPIYGVNSLEDTDDNHLHDNLVTADKTQVNMYYFMLN